ncbi:MaoC family dehydratase N-terminal domain-containing protein [Spongiactinospora sp. TRM90649]|uniref:MaoC family dehydratase N-terminal domain-containing protein n=1 Tax=Spongiactinospora sp. TRM90649 TaxID=3031114 RepID=UPI0023F90DE1|nr:MaoC family dehydratase N-terminal domain-containing protein [Spongiactinospora sp. TRM90649]MDF5752155.1 MaoC family dehydratase N-terminal domain-containing protein [Spongiactinospora sp. TRM90649]
MIDPALIGAALPEHDEVVDRARLLRFADAIGETDPVYVDLTAARAAGHPDLPVPPTFLFCLEMDDPGAFAFQAELGIDTGRVRHGEQTFEYHAMAHAGDRLHIASVISDVYSREERRLDFIVKSTRITRAGEPIATMRNVIVILGEDR